MFKSKTTIVLGAGASAEANLPTGGQLIPIIRKSLNFKFEFGRQKSGDTDIWEVIHRHCRATSLDPNIFAQAGRTISEGVHLANSIDDFMDSHQSNSAIQLVGKLAIIKSILFAERKSTLYFDPHHNQKPDLESLGANWLLPFMRILRQGIAIEDVGDLFQNVTFVSFNYDRCVEHFLYYAIKSFFAGHPTPVETAFEKFRLFFPYGSVGSLECRPRPGSRPTSFGNVDLSIQRAEGIRTYAEQYEAGSELNQIREAVAGSETLIFLGFAFHEPNMKLLTSGKTEIKRVFATVQEISKPDVAIIEKQIRNLCQSRFLAPISFLDGSCHKLFSEYWRSIAA